MTAAQKRLRELRERQSKERQRMAELGMADSLTEETRAELDAIEKGTPDLERQIRAAEVAAEQEDGEAQTRAREDSPGAEMRERIELRSKARLSPAVLGQIGRDLVRSGDSMHVIRVDGSDRVWLLPCASWHFEGGAHPDTWTVRATFYGPSTSTTRHLPYSGVVFVRWGGTPGQPYVGTGPTSWAHTTARLQSEAERSLADEMAGPLAQLVAVPQDGGGDDDQDPLKLLKADIGAARGKALLVETTQAGWGEGKAAAPQVDWKATRLGPQPPEAMATLRKDTFAAVLAACGCSPAMFDDSDGTSKREAMRNWLHGTVRPLGRLLAAELRAKLETHVSLNFDGLYAHDLAGRAAAFQRLVAGGMDIARAAGISGIVADE